MAYKMRDILFKDFITLKRGYDLPTNKRTPGVIPIVSSSGITGNHNDVKVQGPGVITGRSGLIGEVFYIKQDFWPLNTTLYVKDFNNNKPEYVYYFLKTLDLNNYQSGSSVPTLNRNHLDNIKIKIHDSNDQVNIISILSRIDIKIELNKKIIANLEELSQTLFKRWFVDFEFPSDKDISYKSGEGQFIDSLPIGWIKQERIAFFYQHR
ncbi:restriction endonuclease subunit S [Jeotgalicoccus sp. WY2]|uniref:restriction endonuclease subunit S n=1 Tax=Jeotgalicoccus sp. WY2 TaxID=2708346 RepID=UPI001BD49B8D|nr:restriction endonuclease subunit S [Jeotgalicoccus sp. WY2]